jgi:hypothetical protein
LGFFAPAGSTTVAVRWRPAATSGGRLAPTARPRQAHVKHLWYVRRWRSQQVSTLIECTING